MINAQDKFIQQLLVNRPYRKQSVYLSHKLFFPVYFGGYLKCPSAPFQDEIIRLTEQSAINQCFIMAFRGSGKSTIVSTSYPIWAIIGKQQKKLVVIISQTQNQGRFILNNIRRELEVNDTLIKDFGPFNNNSIEWSSNSLDIPAYGAKIFAASTGEVIRGIRNGPNRPDLVILDDVEDIASIKTLDGRDRTHEWFTNEVIPLGDIGTRIIVVGNMLHEDSLMMKLKDYSRQHSGNSVFVSFPLMDENENSLWPGKFTPEVIKNIKESALTPRAFEMEFMLRIVPNDQQIIQRDWIQYYNHFLPDDKIPPPRMIIISVDLAIKKGDGRDKTAILPLYVTGYGRTLQIYILPDIINEQLDFTEQVDTIEKLYMKLQQQFKILPQIYIEDVGFQSLMAQSLMRVQKLPAEPEKIGNLDKPTRLSLVSFYVKTGKVFFPNTGAETLINQILNIYSTKYDDLADAFSMGLNIVVKNDYPSYDNEGRPKKDSSHPHLEDMYYLGGEWHDKSRPITAGMLTEKF